MFAANVHVQFLPLALYQQFKFFFNLYFLLVALSQLIRALQIGFLFTYIAPLAFVLAVSLAKEALDDLKRWRRDVAMNRAPVVRLVPETGGEAAIRASELRVGHLCVVHSGERVPADLLLLRANTPERGAGQVFIRTENLDGETDFKLRRAVVLTQRLERDADLLRLQPPPRVLAEPPRREIYQFQGQLCCPAADPEAGDQVEPLGYCAASSFRASRVVCRVSRERERELAQAGERALGEHGTRVAGQRGGPGAVHGRGDAVGDEHGAAAQQGGAAGARAQPALEVALRAHARRLLPYGAAARL